MSELSFGVLTVSTQLASDETQPDESGDRLVTAVRAADDQVAQRELATDSFGEIRTAVMELCDSPDVDAVVTVGGTGIGPEDVTVGAVSRLFDTDLPGFGEAVRREWYDTLGPSTIGDRVLAGVVTGTPVFCLPGDPAAVAIGADVLLEAAPTLVAASE